MASKIPTPRSYQQILGQMTRSFLSDISLPRLKVGSPILSIFEATAQSDFRDNQNLFNLLNAKNLDNITGTTLEREGIDNGVIKLQETAASGYVTLGDSSFNKVATTIYLDSPAVIIGSGTLQVLDADTPPWPATGSLYIGRGTINEEGPVTYTSIVSVSDYYIITLGSNTTKYHNLGESVILAQGNDRLVSAGTVVQTPQLNINTVQYVTQYDSTILDGEVELENVLVICKQNGVIGNAPSSSITQFSSTPFYGATVTNPLPFSNGIKAETDDELRERIRHAKKSKTKGTALAIETFTIGIVSDVENKRVVTSNLVNIDKDTSVLFIDDGNGYEEKTAGIAGENLVDYAFGGEQMFSTLYRPIAKAFIETALTTPFNVTAGMSLAFEVNGVVTEHTFTLSDFRSTIYATPYELIASINANILLDWSARIAGNGTKISVFAKLGQPDNIQNVTATDPDANYYLGFPTSYTDTCYLYKNDILLYRDGKVASITGNLWSTWANPSGVTATLDIIIDGTPTITVTFNANDFITNNTGFTTVAINSVDAWVTVINAKVPGITATSEINKISLTSNLGADDRASIEISGGTLITEMNLFNAAQTDSGFTSDYTLDNSLGQIYLKEQLTLADTLKLGTEYTEGFIESDEILTPISLTLDANLWVDIDGGATIIGSGINAADTVAVSTLCYTEFGALMKFTAPVTAFLNVERNDQIITWDTSFVSALTNKKWEAAYSLITGGTVTFESPVMHYGRSYFASVELVDGKILLIGGNTGRLESSIPVVTNTCELFDPATKAFTVVDPITYARTEHTATLITAGANAGKVFVFGGHDHSNYLAAGEIYDPVTFSWSAATTTGQPSARLGHTATLMADGFTVLIAGGNTGAATNTCYLYDATADTWTATGALGTARYYHTATLLAPAGGSDIVVAGGQSAAAVLSSTELYDDVAGTWAGAGALPGGAVQHATATLLSTGSVLVVGGSTALHQMVISPAVSKKAALYPPGGPWGATPDIDATIGFAYHAMGYKSVKDEVIISHGYGTSGHDHIWAVYDVGANTWNTYFPAMMSEPARVAPCGIMVTDDFYVFGGQFFETVTGNKTPSSAGFTKLTDATPTVISTWGISLPITDSTTLANNGFDVIRSAHSLDHLTITAGNNYTATSLVSSLSTSLVVLGGDSYTYQTNSIRAYTNTYPTTGSFGLLSADIDALKLTLPVEDSHDSISAHAAYVESTNSEANMPLFVEKYIVGNSSTTSLEINGNDNLSGLMFYSQPVSNLSYSYANAGVFTVTFNRGNNNTGFISSINAFTDRTPEHSGFVTLSKTPYMDWIPNTEVSFISPFRFGQEDDFIFVTDGEEYTKRYGIKMYRKLATVGTTYGVTNEFSDMETGGSLAVPFGLVPYDFDFDDFTALMRARTLTHRVLTPPSSPATTINQTILWRYFRYGQEGEFAKVRYVYPDAPSLPVGVTVDNDNEIAIDINLASGAERTGYSIRNNSKIGIFYADGTLDIVNAYIIANLNTLKGSRDGAGNATLTIDLPGGISDHGLQIGYSIYLDTVDAAFTTGVHVITNRTATSITYVEAVPGAYGPSDLTATVSYDNAKVDFAGVGIAADDFVNSFGGVLGVGRIVTPTDSDLNIKLEGPVPAPYPNNMTAITWSSIGNTSNLVIYTNPKQTATAINTAVNALYTSYYCPIEGTLIGTGLDTIYLSTAEYKDGGANINVWVTNYTTSNVSELLTSDGSLVETFTTGVNPKGICYDGTYIWIANYTANTVSKFLATTGALIGTYATGVNPIGICYDGTNIYTANLGAATITKLLAYDGSFVATYTPPAGSHGICYDGTYLWATHPAGNTVTKLVASDGTVIGTYGTGATPQGICYDGTNIWTANYGATTLTKLLASTGGLVATITVGNNPFGICYDGTNIWCTNYNDDTVTKLVASTGAIIGTYAVGADPTGITYDGTYIWIANNGDNTVTKLLAATGATIGTYATGTDPTFIASSSASYNGPTKYYDLYDGLNYIQSKTIDPLVPYNYSFTFKNAIESSLITGSDWNHEEVRIVPTTTKNVNDWLNCLAVSGAANSTTIGTTEHNSKIQIASNTLGSAGSIEVQGGSANEATANIIGSMTSKTSNTALITLDSDNSLGFTSGQWITIENLIASFKVAEAAIFGVVNVGIDSTTVLTSFSTTGVLTCSAASKFSETIVSVTNIDIQIVKQGQLVCINDGLCGKSSTFVTANVKEGDWIYIQTVAGSTIDVSNLGIYKIIRVLNGSPFGSKIWIENPNVIEQNSVKANIKIIHHASVMVGDTISINSTIWGTDNLYDWTVLDVGTDFTATNTITVDISEHTPSAFTGITPLGINAPYVSVIEGYYANNKFWKQILGISKNQTNLNQVDIILDSDYGYRYITENYYSLIKSTEKLGFPTTLTLGKDAYNYNTGLINEVNKVLYGDRSNPNTYPGIVANGSTVNISSPLIRRIYISLSIRLVNKFPHAGLLDQIRSIVTSKINGSKAGQSIPLDEILTTVKQINGVYAATLVSPNFTVTNDMIIVQPYEKVMIIDPDTDISVSFIGL